MPPIITARVEIRDFRPEDLAAVHRFASDPAVTRYLSWGPNTKEDTRSFLEQAQRHAAERPRTNFELAVVFRQNGEPIGSCGLLGRRIVYHEYEIGFCFRQDYWRRGIGGEVVRALVEFAFSSVGAHRLYGLVDPANTVSAHLLERAGFRLEGHQRRDAFIQGEWRDSLIYALLEDELRPAMT